MREVPLHPTICPYCGAEQVFDQEYVEQLVEKGWTREKAEEHAASSPIFLACPDRSRDMKTPLPVGALEHGAYYHGSCRNAYIARWNADSNEFIYMRQKFGHVYPEGIRCWAGSGGNFDTFRAHGKMKISPIEIPLKIWWDWL